MASGLVFVLLEVLSMKNWGVVCVAGLVLAVAAQGAVADSIYLLPAESQTYQSGSGGEFLWNVTGGTLLDFTSFRSFCLEGQEALNFGETFYFSALSTDAVLGGNATSDPLSAASAWLFKQFWLTVQPKVGDPSPDASFSYDTSSTTARKADAVALQDALWYLEDEIASVSGDAASYVALAQSKAGTGDYEGDEVWVLNLYYDSDHQNRAQDQLVFISNPGAQEFVPLPPALWMGGILIGGIVSRRRLRRRK